MHGLPRVVPDHARDRRPLSGLPLRFRFNERLTGNGAAVTMSLRAAILTGAKGSCWSAQSRANVRIKILE